MKRNLGELERREERLLEAYLSEILELEQFEQKNAQLKQRRESLEREYRELEKVICRELEVSDLAESIEEFSQSIREGLEQTDFVQRKELIELLIDRVVVKDDEVEIRYVVPTNLNGPHYPFSHLRLTYLTESVSLPNP